MRCDVGRAAAVAARSCFGHLEAAPAADVTRTDSAGVEIVRGPAPAWTAGTAARLSPEPRLRIETVDGTQELQLDDVQFASVPSDGRIVSGNGGTSEVRFYHPDGRFQLAVGGEGDGPHEIGDDYVIGVWHDELDVPYVLIYDLIRGS